MGMVVALVMAGLVAGVVVGWTVRRRRRPRAERAGSQRRWYRLGAVRARTMSFRRRSRTQQARIGSIHGSAWLVFVQVQGEFIVIDGLMDTATGGVRQPFWLQVRRPDAPATSTTLESLISTWAADGATVEIETKPSRDGCHATLSAGHSRMGLELVAVGGLAGAA